MGATAQTKKGPSSLPMGSGRLKAVSRHQLIWIFQIPSCFCSQNGKEKKIFFFPLGSRTDLLQRSLDIYGNSPNFSLATLNASSESAVLGQGPENGEGEQA